LDEVSTTMVQIWVCSDACQNFAPNDADFRRPRKRTSSLLVRWLQWLATPRLLLISQLHWLAHMWHVNVLSLLSFNIYYLWLRQNKHLSMKEGSLFCFVIMRCTEPECFRSCTWCLWKALDEEGCMGLVPWCLDLQCKSSWILNDFLTESWIKNRSWKFRRNWKVPLVLLETSWWAGFNGIYLVRFGFRMWEILIFKWFLPLKIQTKSRKPGFGRKNQLRTW
jgi:hypothetical protein